MKQQTIAVFSIAIVLMTVLGYQVQPVLGDGTHTAYLVGAQGGAASQSTSKGIGSWIKVVVPQTIVTSSTTHYFWSGQYLTTNDFVHAGYSVKSTNQNLAEFWLWTYNTSGATQCSKFTGSGTNGQTYHIYQYSSGTTWYFYVGSTLIGTCVMQSANGDNARAFVIAEVSASTGISKDAGNILGPSDYGYPAIEYIGSSDGLWHDFPDGIAFYQAKSPLGGQAHVCSPYGVVGTGFNKMKAGHNVSCTASGTILW